MTKPENLHEEILKIHQILDEHNKDEFEYRKLVAKQHEDIMNLLTPMAKTFRSASDFNNVSFWILKRIITIGAAFAVIVGGIHWLKGK